MDNTGQMISNEPEFFKGSINDVDFLLLGCDGIWETKNDLKIC